MLASITVNVTPAHFIAGSVVFLALTVLATCVGTWLGFRRQKVYRNSIQKQIEDLGRAHTSQLYSVKTEIAASRDLILQANRTVTLQSLNTDSILTASKELQRGMEGIIGNLDDLVNLLPDKVAHVVSEVVSKTMCEDVAEVITEVIAEDVPSARDIAVEVTEMNDPRSLAEYIVDEFDNKVREAKYVHLLDEDRCAIVDAVIDAMVDSEVEYTMKIMQV